MLVALLSSACQNSTPRVSSAASPSPDRARDDSLSNRADGAAKSDWRQKWRLNERVVVAEAGSLQVIPFLLDGEGFHYYVVDQSNVFGGLVVEGGENDDPIAMTVPLPNWSGRELKIVEVEESSHATSTVVIAPYQGPRDDRRAIDEDFMLGISQLTASLHCDIDRVTKSITRAPLGDSAVMLETSCKTKYGDRELVMWAIYGAKARVVIWYSVVGPAGNPRIERARAFGPFTTAMRVR